MTLKLVSYLVRIESQFLREGTCLLQILKLETELMCYWQAIQGNLKALSKKTITIIPKSRYESSQHSSAKSLTAIVLKEDERYSLRLGPILIPMAKGSVCALNEISTMSMEDQNYLLDIAEEGQFTLNKYGFNTKVNSPTVIIASTNLTEQREYPDPSTGKISLDQIPLQRQLLDRFDLIVILKDTGDIEAIKEYTEQKIQLQPKFLPKNDLFLQMYLEYSRKIEPEISPEARSMVAQYYVNLNKCNRNLRSKRVLETLIRLSKKVAKLRLKDVVESEDVFHATKFYNILINCYLPSLAVIPQDPFIRCIERCRNILEEKGIPTLFSEILKRACFNDEYIRSYITGSQSGKVEDCQLTPDKNKKIRKIRKMLKKDENILIIDRNPFKITAQTKQSHHRTNTTAKPVRKVRKVRLNGSAKCMISFYWCQMIMP